MNPHAPGLHDPAAALQAVLEVTSDGILLTDGEGRVVAWNRRLLDLWRVPLALERDPRPEALLAHAAAQLAGGVLPPRVRELCHDAGAAGHALLEFADGRVFEAYVRPAPHRAGAGRAWSFVDVSETRLVEAVVRRGEERAS